MLITKKKNTQNCLFCYFLRDQEVIAMIQREFRHVLLFSMLTLTYKYIYVYWLIFTHVHTEYLENRPSMKMFNRQIYDLKLKAGISSKKLNI